MMKKIVPIFVIMLALLGGARTAMATCAAPTAEEGYVFYNADHKVMQFCNGVAWVSMADSGYGEDVLSTLSCSNNELANWDGSVWVCYPVPSDTLSSLSCTTGQIPKWDGSAWGCGSDTGGSGGGAVGEDGTFSILFTSYTDGLNPGEPIEDLFSVDLYTGTGGSQKVTNGIDLATNGGLVWKKERNQSYWHYMYDTERGPDKALATNLANAEATHSGNLTSFDSDGFTGALGGHGASVEGVTWTFREAPKFFDIVTYTGDATNDFSKTVNHDLGQVPGMIIIKSRTDPYGWLVWHRSLVGKPNSGNPGYGHGNYAPSGEDRATNLVLQTTQNAGMQNSDGVHYVTDSSFAVANFNGFANQAQDYVAYIFAHDESANGGIQCGEYVGDGTTDGSNAVTLGWEPQWLMLKKANNTGDWYIYDSTRKTSNPRDSILYANENVAEATGSMGIDFTATSFEIKTAAGGVNGSGDTFIYCAIRASGGAVGSEVVSIPEDETVEDVFSTDIYDGTASNQTITNGIDLAGKGGLTWIKTRSGYYSSVDHTLYDSERGIGNMLKSNTTDSEFTSRPEIVSYNSDGFTVSGGSSLVNQNPSLSPVGKYAAWTFRESPNFFDIVSYTGNSSTDQTLSHDLGVEPGMIFLKALDNGSGSSGYWGVYHRSATGDLILNGTNAHDGVIDYVANVTSTNFDARIGYNDDGIRYVAYLFAHDASANGVIQCGTYEGDGTTDGSNAINLGWAVQWLIYKNADASTDPIGDAWNILDTERGATGTSFQTLRANLSGAETGSGNLELTSTGFEVSSPNTNTSGETYIYCAIRATGGVVSNAVELPPTHGTLTDTTASGALADLIAAGDSFEISGSVSNNGTFNAALMPDSNTIKVLQNVVTEGPVSVTITKTGNNGTLGGYVCLGNQVLRWSDTVGKWECSDTTSSDDLGSHVATQTIDISSNKVTSANGFVYTGVTASAPKMAGGAGGTGTFQAGIIGAAVEGNACTNVGQLAYGTGNKLLVCEGTEPVTDVSCSDFNIGALTFSSEGTMHVCTQ